MESKKEFIGEIQRHLSEASVPRPKRHTKKLLSRLTPLGAVLIAASMISMGALINFIWTQATITIEGPIDVNGQIEEIVELYYDDVQLTGTELTITAMDYDVLNPGDSYTTTHEIRNENGHSYDFTLDLSGMPLNYIDPENVWFGLTIKPFEHGTTTELTTFSVNPMETYEFDLFYAVDPLFKHPEPIVAFPFLMSIDIELNEETLTPMVTVTYPNGGEVLNEGVTYDVIYTYVDIPVGATATIFVTVDGGGTLELASGMPVTGAYSWTIPMLGQDYSDTLTVEIYDSEATLLCTDTSDASFTLHNF